MSDKKNIDRLFQEKLKNFEASPSDAVWENIHAELHKDKRKRRLIIPIWWRVAGVAALLALLFAIGNSVFDSSSETNTNTPIVNTEEAAQEPSNTNPEDITQPNAINPVTVASEDSNNTLNQSSDDILNEDDPLLNQNKEHHTSVVKNSSDNNPKTNKEVIVTNQNKPPLQKNNSTINPQTENAVVKNATNLPKPNLKTPSEKIQEDIDALTMAQKESTQNTIANNTSEKEDDNLTKSTEAPSIEDAIAMADDTDEKEEEKEKLNRWNISPNVAPVYFNTLGKGSSIDGQFVNNTKEGDVNMSYGLGGSYAINKKLKIRAGVNKVELGYNTNNVIAFNGVNSRNSGPENIKFNDSTTIFMSAESFDFTSSPEILNTNVKGSLEQRLGFIEVPLEVEYNLIDKKIGLNVIGGFSTLFLTKNEIYSNLEGNRTKIGEATNINSTSYSANLGLGVNYNVSEKIKVNLEPMFKYQMNTFNNSSGDFKPYFIGVYTGLSYKF